MFVANTFGLSVSVIDVVSDSVIDTIQLGTLPLSIAINPNGTRVYTTNGTTNTVSVIDARTHAVVDVIAVDSSPEAIAVSPDGAVAHVSYSVSDEP